MSPATLESRNNAILAVSTSRRRVQGQGVFRPTILLIAAIFHYGASAMPPQREEATTLHVYTNLIEVPVLVLSGSRERLPPIDQKDFGLRLNSGPSFRPTYVRREGEDPIALALLIDSNGAQPDLLPALHRAFAALSPAFLHPQDRLTVYDLHCTLSRTIATFPLDPKLIERALDDSTGAQTPKATRDKQASCQDPVHLWDAMAVVANDLKGYSGRRVLLVVTNGNDSGSSTSWNKLKTFAADGSVTLFALSEPDVVLAGSAANEEYLSMLCELTGGMVIRSSANRLPKALSRFVTMLRERYIIYFPRSNKLPAGHVDMEVTVGRNGAFVRPTGTWVPLADPKIVGAPDTIPPDPTKAPVIGSRRALHPPSPHR